MSYAEDVATKYGVGVKNMYAAAVALGHTQAAIARAAGVASTTVNAAIAPRLNKGENVKYDENALLAAKDLMHGATVAPRANPTTNPSNGVTTMAPRNVANPLDKLGNLFSDDKALVNLLRAAWNTANPDAPIGPEAPLPRETFGDALDLYTETRTVFETLGKSLKVLTERAAERKARKDAVTAMGKVPGMTAATIAATLGMVEADVRAILAPPVAAPPATAPTVAQ